MAIQISGQVGEQNVSDGVSPLVRQGKQGDFILSELNPRFYEQNYRNRVFSGGMGTVAAITASTYNVTTLGVTATPIIGVWNPGTSLVNLVIIKAVLNLVKTALQNTGCAPFLWCTSTGNSGITTGNPPLSRKSLSTAGSSAKDMSNVALTGMTNNLVARGAAALGGGSGSTAAFLETQAGSDFWHFPSVELFDGDLIVPPGGVLALLASTAPVAVSAASMLVWEEVPI